MEAEENTQNERQLVREVRRRRKQPFFRDEASILLWKEESPALVWSLSAVLVHDFKQF